MERPPVILLHGCGGSPEQAFERTGWITAFQRAGRRVRALRLPGHGHDNPPHDPLAYADLAGVTVGDLPAGECDLVGFSLGAKIALAIAVRYPGRVRRMVLGGIGDNAFAPETVGEQAACALEGGLDDQTPPPVRAFLDTFDPALNDPLAIAAILRRPANPVLTEGAVAAIRAPVAVVNGGADFVTNMGSRLIDVLRVDQVVLLGVSHFELTAQPAFRDAAVGFLAEAQPPSSGPQR
jgi:pimeloyl-ACP methyl ester carboxylesterase